MFQLELRNLHVIIEAVKTQNVVQVFSKVLRYINYRPAPISTEEMSKGLIDLSQLFHWPSPIFIKLGMKKGLYEKLFHAKP